MLRTVSHTYTYILARAHARAHTHTHTHTHTYTYTPSFTIKRNEVVHLTTSQARSLLADAMLSPSFDKTLHYMTSGPVIGLVLEHTTEDVVPLWLATMGPAEPMEAKHNSPTRSGWQDWCGLNGNIIVGWRMEVREKEKQGLRFVQAVFG